MEKRLKIITFPDTNPEFMQLQIDSFRKHMDDGNTDLVMYNSANENYNIINEICNKNNIECVDYTGNKGTPFPNKCVEQLNWFRDTIQNKCNDYILFIHSDMFFINKLDYKKLLSEKKIIYNPHYRDSPMHRIHDGSFGWFYMWDGVLLFDSEYINQNNLTQYFDWNFVRGVTDMGGKTQQFLEKLNPNDASYFEFWTYHHLNNNILCSGLNGAMTFNINLDTKKLESPPQMGNKTYPYEKDNDDYENYIVEKIIKIKELFIDPLDFINPVHGDFIQVIDEPIEESFIYHFKGGSQSTDSNKVNKLEQIRRLVFR